MSLSLISKHISILVFCILGILFYSCKPDAKPKASGESKVTVLYWGDERIFLADYWGMEATYLMFLPLFIEEGDENGEPRGMLAEKWEHSADWREWTFHLRNNIKWHDGVSVTAYDIQFTLDLRMTGIVDTLRPFSVKVIDDYTIVIHYKKPTDAYSDNDVYYPKHLLKDLDPEEFFNWDFWAEPIGNGPYRYVRHVPKTMIEVESNPDYIFEEPKIKHVILKFAKDMSLIELISGNVDILPYVERNMLIKLDGDERFESYYWIGNQAFCIYWNHNHPLFESSEIRKALTLAINRNELKQVMNYPEELPIIDALTTSRQLKNNYYPTPLPYDPKKAVRILEDEGWSLEQGKDVREREGRKFQFTVLTSDENDQIPLYIQDQFKKIGLQMDIQTLDNSVFRQRAFKGEYDALSWQASLTPGKNPNWDHFKVYGKSSPFGYNNPQMESLLEIADTTISPQILDSLYDRISKIFREDIPITFLFQGVQTHLVKRNIKGLKSPYISNPVYNMEHLWIDESN